MQNNNFEYILTPYLIDKIVEDLTIQDILNFRLSCKYVSRYTNFYQSEKLSDRLDWTLLSRKKMTFGFMNHYRNWLDWNEVVKYGEIKNIIQFPAYFGINLFYESRDINEFYIEQYIKTHFVSNDDWRVISIGRKLSEKFVEKYMDKLHLNELLYPCRCQTCREENYENIYSEKFLDLILTKVDNFYLFNAIIKNYLKISEKFILDQLVKFNRHKKLDVIDLESLFTRRYVPNVIEYLMRKNIKLPWRHICKYHILPPQFIEKYQWYIDWDELSLQKLPAEIVIKYQDCLNLFDVFNNNYYCEKDIELMEDLIQENNLWWRIKDIPKKFKEKYLMYIKPSKYLPKDLTFKTYPDFRAFEELTQEEIVNIVKTHKKPRIFIIILFLSRKIPVETIMALTPYLYNRKYFKICVDATLRPDKIVSKIGKFSFLQKQKLMLKNKPDDKPGKIVLFYQIFYEIVKNINIVKSLPDSFKKTHIDKMIEFEEENVRIDGIREIIMGLMD